MNASIATYFDESKNKADKLAYYKGINVNNASELSALLFTTHKNQLSYKPSLYLYPLVDKQPSNKLSSIYSGIEYTLEELLQMDAAVDLQRKKAMEEIVAANPQRLVSDEELSFIEANLPYNCEHVVCQSWFNKEEPMKGDLHHLFACESGCNSFRNNHKYFDFKDSERIIRDKCGRLENDVFEPEKNKGIVARAVLYFLLRYPKVIKQYAMQDVQMLLSWHKSHAVSLYELHRNQEIYKLQGNRNPIIDFPELADKLTFPI